MPAAPASASASASASDTRTHTTPFRRRNGKLQSCEPCRKRKLSCDHTLPACGRCVRRKHASECSYHPAPMTRSNPRGLPSPASTKPSPAAHPAERTCEQLTLPPTHAHAFANEQRDVPQPRPVPRTEHVPALERIQEIMSVPSAGILMNGSAARRPVGYLGGTSSSAFVAALNDSLGIDNPATLHEPHTEHHLSDDYLQNGARVLTFFQATSKMRAFMEKLLAAGDSFLMYIPVYRVWFNAMVPVFENTAHSTNLVGLSAQLWCNTQRPLPCTREITAHQWAHSATGPNLRWEVLGLILTEVGFVASSLPAWDPIFRGGDNRTTMMHTTMELVTICIDLSKRCGSRNELLTCLLYGKVRLTSIQKGDTSSEVWTSFSEVCDTVVLLGLHLEVPATGNVPFFLRELRSHIFNVVYSMDKFMATFLGRPPRASFRYSVVREPHDLTDLEVCSSPQDLRRRLAELSSTGGWSTTGTVARATWRKAWTRRHILREEILEIVISPHVTDIAARVEYIRSREQEAFASMPEFCRLDPEQLITDIKRDPTLEIPTRGVPWRPADVLCFLALHCGRAHAEFLLERAVVNKTKCDSSRLISTAKSLLSLILKANTLRDFLLEFQLDLTDSLAFYAVPAAGVLAIEILQRDQLHDPSDGFPRSEVLQQLSVLVPALDAVRPDEGNYPLCAMGSSAIKKVLDRLLSNPPRRPLDVDAEHADVRDTHVSVNMGSDADFLQWLGNLDFDTTDWSMAP